VEFGAHISMIKASTQKAQPFKAQLRELMRSTAKYKMAFGDL